MGDRKYPSIMEIALRAGKWSVIAGASAALIGGSTGCEVVESDPDQDVKADVLDSSDPGLMGDDAGVTDIGGYDVQEVVDNPDYGFPELMGIAPYDIGGYDVPLDVIDPDPGLMGDDVPQDVNEPDPGLMGDFVDDAYYPPEDVVNPDDPGATADVPPVDVVEDDTFLSGDMPMADIVQN